MSFPDYQSPTPGSAPSNQATRYPQLNSILRTEEGFHRSINYKGAADSALSVVLVIAVLGVVWNLINTFQSLSSQGLPVGRYFWTMFFEVRNTSGNISPYFWATVWLPVIAVPVMIILLIARKATRAGSVTKLYQQYLQAGFLAELQATGIITNVNNNDRGPVCVFGAPNIPPDWVAAAVQRINAGALTDKKSPECKAYLSAIQRAIAVGFGVQAKQANQADPSLPDGIFITGQRNLVSPVRVALPIGNDFTRLRLIPLVKNAPLA